MNGDGRSTGTTSLMTSSLAPARAAQRTWYGDGDALFWGSEDALKVFMWAVREHALDPACVWSWDWRAREQRCDALCSIRDPCVSLSSFCPVLHSLHEAQVSAPASPSSLPSRPPNPPCATVFSTVPPSPPPSIPPLLLFPTPRTALLTKQAPQRSSTSSLTRASTRCRYGGDLRLGHRVHQSTACTLPRCTALSTALCCSEPNSAACGCAHTVRSFSSLGI